MKAYKLLLTLFFALAFFIWYEVQEYQRRWVLRYTMTRL